jgi:uncharacterized protein YdhG (YjbR/CyaY superfamily)
MDAISTRFKTVDEYLQAHPVPVHTRLQELRKAIVKSAPEADEVISYNMPAYKLKGPLIYFAAYKEHIGFYPTPSAVSAFKKEIAKYEQSKGTVRFPIDKPIPSTLVSRMVKFRVKENLEKASLKLKSKSKK